jgi:hypothetical protein
MNAERVDEIIDGYDAERAASLAILQDIQREYNFLPREALELVAQRLDVPVGHVYQMATFFKAFSLKPRGDYLIKVCLGTACHVQDSRREVLHRGGALPGGMRAGADRGGERGGVWQDVDRSGGQAGRRLEPG